MGVGCAAVRAEFVSGRAARAGPAVAVGQARAARGWIMLTVGRGDRKGGRALEAWPNPRACRPDMQTGEPSGVGHEREKRALVPGGRTEGKEAALKWWEDPGFPESDAPASIQSGMRPRHGVIACPGAVARPAGMAMDMERVRIARRRSRIRYGQETMARFYRVFPPRYFDMAGDLVDCRMPDTPSFPTPRHERLKAILMSAIALTDAERGSFWSGPVGTIRRCCRRSGSC